MKNLSRKPARMWWIVLAALFVFAAALVGVWTSGKASVQGIPKAKDSGVVEANKPASQVIPSYPGSVPDAKQLLSKAEIMERWEIAKLIHIARRDEIARFIAKWPQSTRPDREEEERMLKINNRELELLRPWRMMDLSSDETPIGEGHTIGEMVRDLFANTNYLDVARDEVVQSLRDAGAGEASLRAESTRSMNELMLVAGENREIVEAYVDRMYDDAKVNWKWREMFEDRGRFAALDRLSRVYNESLDKAETSDGR